jgi:hypothetical protein
VTSEQLSFGQRVYRGLFKIFGPADVGPSGPPAAINPDDKTVPEGYHLETITDGSGIRRRIAIPDSPDTPDAGTDESPGPKPSN